MFFVTYNKGLCVSFCLGTASLHDNEFVGDIEFLCSVSPSSSALNDTNPSSIEVASAAAATTTGTALSDVGIFADCAGDAPKVQCPLSCCDCR